eukprot:GHVR01039030.1.p1 GENE.GHVR01039030.1~~GHVR01039030.1.p1  ORF type:complete len:150 (+),score=21.37 GHVR01039030.1:176-625(+)
MYFPFPAHLSLSFPTTGTPARLSPAPTTPYNTSSSESSTAPGPGLGFEWGSTVADTASSATAPLSPASPTSASPASPASPPSRAVAGARYPTLALAPDPPPPRSPLGGDASRAKAGRYEAVYGGSSGVRVCVRGNFFRTLFHLAPCFHV